MIGRLELAQPFGPVKGLHDLQGRWEINRPVTATDVVNQLIKARPVLIRDRESNCLRRQQISPSPRIRHSASEMQRVAHESPLTAPIAARSATKSQGAGSRLKRRVGGRLDLHRKPRVDHVRPGVMPARADRRTISAEVIQLSSPASASEVREWVLKKVTDPRE